MRLQKSCPALLMFVLLTALVSCTGSRDIQAGSDRAQDFVLFGTDYKYHRLSDYLTHDGIKAVVLIFTSNHCPMSVDYEDTLIHLAGKYQPLGIQFIAVNPNPADMVPEDGFPQMVARAGEKEFPYPYLYDETQDTARAYGAVCTPEVFLIDRTGMIVYAGAVDEWGGSRSYLADALDDLLAGRQVLQPRTPPLGCMIEYRR